MNVNADTPLTPAVCAQRAASLLESAEQHRGDRTLQLVEIADGWRRLGETLSENAAMLPTSPATQG